MVLRWRVDGVRAVASGSAFGGVARMSVAMPLDWMVRGYVKAVRRFDEAAAAPIRDARDVSIALFEASNWVDSLSDRIAIAGDVMVQGFLFVRHRTPFEGDFLERIAPGRVRSHTCP